MAFYKEGSVGDARFAESVMHSIKVIADNTTIIANACNTEKEKEKIKTEDIPELIGEIIDVFEEFLDEEDFLDEEYSEIPMSESEVYIYGSYYDILSSRLNMLLKNWDII